LYVVGHRREDLTGTKGGKALGIESLFTVEEEHSFM